MFSGLAVPVALKVFGRGSWSIAWTVQAGLALVLAIVLMCRRASLRAGPTPVQAGTKQGRICSRMIWLLGGYLLYGAGYVAYVLFMMAWVQDSGREAGVQAAFWAVIGAAAMASPWIWTPLLERQNHGIAFSILSGVTAVAAILPHPSLPSSEPDCRATATTRKAIWLRYSSSSRPPPTACLKLSSATAATRNTVTTVTKTMATSCPRTEWGHQCLAPPLRPA